MGGTIGKIGVYSTDSVRKHTGKDWDEWVALLDKAGARAWAYAEIGAFLNKKHRLGFWWRHAVTGGYEVAIGRRLEGRNAKGECSSTSTRTLSLDGKAAWRLLVSEAGLRCWLKPLGRVTLKPGNFFETSDGFFGEIRTQLAGRRIRLSWQDPDWPKRTFVQVLVVPRPNGRAMLAFQHEKLMDTRVKARLGKRWREALDQLERLGAAP